jgi:hypothetical protein
MHWLNQLLCVSFKTNISQDSWNCTFLKPMSAIKRNTKQMTWNLVRIDSPLYCLWWHNIYSILQECCETAICLGRMTLWFLQDYFSPTVTHADSVWVGASWMRPKPSGHILIWILYSLIAKKDNIKQHCILQDLLQCFQASQFRSWMGTTWCIWQEFCRNAFPCMAARRKFDNIVCINIW